MAESVYRRFLHAKQAAESEGRTLTVNQFFDQNPGAEAEAEAEARQALLRRAPDAAPLDSTSRSSS